MIKTGLARERGETLVSPELRRSPSKSEAGEISRRSVNARPLQNGMDAELAMNLNFKKRKARRTVSSLVKGKTMSIQGVELHVQFGLAHILFMQN